MAVLFAPGAQPASADHGGDDTVTIWSGTLTVQNVLSIFTGCDNTDSGTECSSALTDDDFTYEGVDNAVINTQVTGGSLDFVLDKAIPQGSTLHVGSDQFAVADAQISNGDKHATWQNTGLSWTVGDTVQLSLSAPRPSGVVLSTETLAIDEDSVGSDTFALADDPGGSATVTLVRTQFFQNDYGESDRRWNLNAASVSPETLTFTSSN